MLKVKLHVRFHSQRLDGSAQTNRYSPSLRCRLTLLEVKVETEGTRFHLPRDSFTVFFFGPPQLGPPGVAVRLRPERSYFIRAHAKPVKNRRPACVRLGDGRISIQACASTVSIAPECSQSSLYLYDSPYPQVNRSQRTNFLGSSLGYRHQRIALGLHA